MRDKNKQKKWNRSNKEWSKLVQIEKKHGKHGNKNVQSEVLLTESTEMQKHNGTRKAERGKDVLGLFQISQKTGQDVRGKNVTLQMVLSKRLGGMRER